MIDLHTHSCESDGTMTPRELVLYAKSKGVSAMALTDHDTVAGLEEARAAARGAGMGFIPGIEIEVAFSGGEFHLLGLGITNWKGRFEETLKAVKEDREYRNRGILKRIREAGISAEYSEVEDLAGGEIVGRPHFARLLVARGVAKNMDDAFKRFLKKGMPYFVAKRALTLREATDLVHTAGGKAIIAHPLSLYIGWKAFPDRLKTFQAEGVDGIEAYHSNATMRECRRLADIAAELGLMTTAGSDFHGEHIPSRRIGRTCEGMPIDDAFAEPFLRTTAASGNGPAL